MMILILFTIFIQANFFCYSKIKAQNYPTLHMIQRVRGKSRQRDGKSEHTGQQAAACHSVKGSCH